MKRFWTDDSKNNLKEIIKKTFWEKIISTYFSDKNRNTKCVQGVFVRPPTNRPPNNLPPTTYYRPTDHRLTDHRPIRNIRTRNFITNFKWISDKKIWDRVINTISRMWVTIFSLKPACIIEKMKSLKVKLIEYKV